MLERLWVVLVVVGYLGAGGLLFQLIEPPPPNPKLPISKYTENCLNQLWTITERLNVLYQRNWTRLVTEQLRQLEVNVIQAVRAQGRENTLDPDLQWSFTGSLLYSLTVITTIGCGNLGPKTMEGKLATMIYALIGVPLMLVCLSHLGSLLADIIQSAYYYVCCCSKQSKNNERMEYQMEERGARMRSVEVVGGGCGRAVCRLTSLDSMLDYTPRSNSVHDSDDDELENNRGGATNDTPSRMPLIWRGESRPGTPPPPPTQAQPPSTRTRVPALLTLAILLGYICLGAWLYAAWERRTYLEGLYFTFTALTTIGLSDMVPGRGIKRIEGQLQLLAFCLYIFFGLVLVATAFALVQEQVITKTRQIAISLGVVKREELPL
ncbi:TWiK family of potassium channels protein 9-like [Cimex lectularius]|uniref:Potassium channel domain-containing protein n=1 Tax=Cimex lectularius TaxID=79782 RepID=A0A8I6RQI4_CIMLE|nr:TWiK family of potassium channels protein 9-like [Cimex lectularius]XP_014246339.1 TWiK family of potassium channels protein 9-like [Cimex lectularius]XP_014246341.1 TWiK family of potassium channels protein 9-like [Cimex lectularius]